MKKIILVLLSLSMLLVSVNVVSASASKFKDVKEDHWARPQIEEAAKKGFIKGYPGGTFKPASNITRAEFASILSKATKLEAEEESRDVFADVPAGNWARESIDKLVSLGIINTNDYKNGSKASEFITRYEMIKWMVNGLAVSDISFKEAMKDTEGTLVPFTEFYKGGIAADKIPYIAVARGTQLTLGLPDGSFGLNQPTTRAEVAVIMQRYVALEGTKADTYRELTELRDVGKTGTNMMMFDAKIGLFDGKPLFFENVVGKEVKTETGGTLKVHRYIVVDESEERGDKPVGVYANMFITDFIRKFSNTYSAYIEVSYTPAIAKISTSDFMVELDYITGEKIYGENPAKYGYATYKYNDSFFVKGKEQKFWVHEIYNRNSHWTNIKAKDGSLASFRFN